MGKLAAVVGESLKRYIQDQPLSFLLFMLGVLLLLLGLTTGIKWLVPDDRLRWIAILFGAGAIGASILVGLFGPGRDPSQVDTSPRMQTPGNLPEKPVELSQTQKNLLRAIEDAGTGRSLVEQDRLLSLLRLTGSPATELFYRLEQLRLLGFVEREEHAVRSDVPRFLWRLSADYAERLRRDTTFVKVSRPSSTANG